MTDSKDTIILKSGIKVPASHPVIVSASRSTDIPAFFAKWFMQRLSDGYSVWINPFNQSPMYVSYDKTRVIVFWTKNPRPLMPYLDELDKTGIHYYFQFTLNDYEKEGFEPNVASLEKRIETFKELSNRIGKDRVIWRFDPLIITPNLTARDLLIKIWNLSKRLKGYTSKLVFSFIDVEAYRKVQNNLIKETNGLFTKDNVLRAELSLAQKEEIADGLKKIQHHWHEQGWDFTLATCAEDIDLEKYGIEHNRCIDGELMERLFSDDKVLTEYLHSFDKKRKPKDTELDLFASLEGNTATSVANTGAVESNLDVKRMKDKGQRKECGCMVSKDIGMYNTCSHGCIYCYANTSKAVVAKNRQKIMQLSESIIPFNQN